MTSDASESDRNAVILPHTHTHTHRHINTITVLQQYYELSLLKQDAQLSQRDRAAGCVIVFAISRRLELGDNILRTV